jgi:hypothetical protein
VSWAGARTGFQILGLGDKQKLNFSSAASFEEQLQDESFQASQPASQPASQAAS